MRIAFYFLILIFLLSCTHKDYPEFKKSGNNYFKILELGEEQKIEVGDFVKAYITVQNLRGDSVHYVPDYPYFFQIQYTDIDSLFLKLHMGDSAIFIVHQNKLKEYFPFFHLQGQTKSPIKVHIRVLDIYSNKDESIHAMADMLKHRKNNEEVYFKKLLLQKAYKLDTLGGDIYLTVIEEGDGSIIKDGKLVSMHYRAMFPNGYEFESTYDRKESMTFIYGEALQVIQGINIGLKGRKEGDKLKIFISSQLGFGEKGSIAGIVPPFTTLIYEIEIKKVKD